MTTRQKKCSELVSAACESAGENLDILVALEMEGNEEGHPDLGHLHEYGLSFDYVPADTFNDQDAGYFRYQLSWGGPSTEYRLYADADMDLYRVEFWYLDWFDGASVRIPHRPADRPEWLSYLWEMWRDCGSLEAEMERSRE